jgi:hypothetical protein
VPVDAVVKPAAEPVVEGALQPVGTTRVTEPLLVPPVAAVYVKVIVFPVELAETAVVGVVNVPDPFAANADKVVVEVVMAVVCQLLSNAMIE